MFKEFKESSVLITPAHKLFLMMVQRGFQWIKQFIMNVSEFSKPQDLSMHTVPHHVCHHVRLQIIPVQWKYTTWIMLSMMRENNFYFKYFYSMIAVVLSAIPYGEVLIKLHASHLPWNCKFSCTCLISQRCALKQYSAWNVEYDGNFTWLCKDTLNPYTIQFRI